VTNFRWFFQLTHDAWLLLLLMDILFLAALYIRKHGVSFRTASSWGLVGGLAMLTSPIAGFVWLVLAVTLVRGAGCAKKMLLAVSVMLLLCCPWFVRNYLVFEKIIFMKSNLYFDLYHYYQAPDGIVNED
jgi:hypothetical protein